VTGSPNTALAQPQNLSQKQSNEIAVYVANKATNSDTMDPRSAFGVISNGKTSHRCKGLLIPACGLHMVLKRFCLFPWGQL
jgi:hypothetical protein